MIYMKRIIMLVILTMMVFSCELLDTKRWDRINREDAERGVRCYKDRYGNVYCEDKYGNKAY